MTDQKKTSITVDLEKAALNKRLETIAWGLFLIVLGRIHVRAQAHAQCAGTRRTLVHRRWPDLARYERSSLL